MVVEPRSGGRAIQSGNVAWRKNMHGVVQSVSQAPTVGGMPSSVEVDDGYRPGLEGVVAFRTEIAEPDRDGGALRYRGVDIEDLAGHVTFGDVWALLVDGRFGQGPPPSTG